MNKQDGDGDGEPSLIQSFIAKNLVGNCGLDIHGVYTVDTIDVSENELFQQHGLAVEEVVAFLPDNATEAACYRDQSEVQNAGVTILVKIGGLLKPAIFLRRVMNDHAGMDDLARYGITLHELGHAEDMILGVNLRKGEPFSLAKAEAYAEVFCLRQLNKRKEDISIMTRDVFAKRLLKMNEADAFKKSIYAEAIKKIRREKLVRWARKAMFDLT
ncbi:hypothetical protein [Pseudomonas atacamensis]|uniref:hypothetical protein n=1 Tax=Pseudomonas atacamensis TaxID=2565368 RepID=UPI002B1D867A|nr:hypothetical protein [Pseudomonas atacamensis]